MSVATPECITINGNDLTLAKIAVVLSSRPFNLILDERVKVTINASAQFLKAHASTKIIYGVNTGFGPMASYLINDDQLIQLQYNLVRSHAVGLGQTMPAKYVLAAMVIRLNTLAKGHSGVSLNLLKQLQQMIHHRIIPLRLRPRLHGHPGKPAYGGR